MKTRRYDSPFDEVVEAIIASIESSGMLLVADIDVRKNAAKRGIELTGNRILEVSRLDYAARIWAMEIEAGVDIPIRIHVHEDEGGGVTVRCRTPLEVLSRHGNDELTLFAAELDPVFEKIVCDPMRRRRSVA
ncbi:MAG: DUF302 domain-containing protein [Rubrobacteraceae bacterium]|jgi:uncharacterized protein (DUF302 family)